MIKLKKRKSKRYEPIKEKKFFRIYPQKKPSIYKSKTETAEKSSILNQKDFAKG